MIDYHSQLVSTLSGILPTHYELVVNSKTKTPCITYLELSNAASANGDTLGYSKIVYQVKVWGTALSDIQKYASQVDDALRPLGFIRRGSRELFDNNSSMIFKEMTFEATGLEQFIGGTV